MSFLTLVVVLAGIGVWNAVSQVRHRLEVAERRLDSLERRAAEGAGVRAAEPATTHTRLPVRSAGPAPAPTAASPVTTAGPAGLSASPASLPAEPSRPPASPSRPPAEPSSLPPAAAPDAAAQGSAEAWEVVVGASWANKIGAAFLVIGIALALGYAMPALGPAGRVAVGYAASLAMLGAGVQLERRERYRLYAYGLIGGGWAGAYFTTYAVRNVPAAQLISSDLLAAALLTAVAAGMIWHSLRYRSKTATSLAYVIAFVTLGLTPLTTFSLVAALPLAASLLVVSQRFGWTDLSVLGVASTYLVFALRPRVFAGDALDGTAWVPYLLLATYWITFEAADIVGRRLSPAALPPSLFALNAVGFMAAGLLQLPDRSTAFAAFAATASVAYLASALVRARLLGPAEPIAAAAPGVTTTHAATGLAAALAVVAVTLQFSGTPEIVALLLVTEMIFVSGLTLGDRLVRHMAAPVAAFATFRLLEAAGGPAADLAAGTWSIGAWTAPALLVATAWYAHREWLRARGTPPAPLELGYTWAATWLVLLVLVRELQPVHAGLAAWLLTVVLVEAGLRRGTEYRYEGYAVGLLSVFWLTIVTVFDDQAIEGIRRWTVLPGAALIGYGLAWRLAIAASRPGVRTMAPAAVAAAAGTLFVAILEVRLLPLTLVGPALAATGIALTALAVGRGIAAFRWHGYALFVAGTLRAFNLIVRPDQATMAEIAGLGAAFTLTAAGLVLARHGMAAEGERRGWTRDLETVLRPSLSLFATALLTAGLALEVRSDLLTLAWGVEGLVLLAAGFPARERVLRLSGLAVFSFCIGRLLFVDLSGREALVRIASFLALGLFLLAVSWVYTRFREQITRFM